MHNNYVALSWHSMHSTASIFLSATDEEVKDMYMDMLKTREYHGASKTDFMLDEDLLRMSFTP